MTDSPTSFNLYDVAQVLRKNWKPVVWFMIVVLLVTALLLVFVLPKYYRSTAVVVPTNPELGDKGWLLNKNLRQLYSVYTNEQDLDRLMAIAKLDTVYKTVVKEYQLVQYYQLANEGFNSELKAARKLKKDVTIEKSDLGELRIKVDTKVPTLSADIANRITEIVQSIAQQSWIKVYSEINDQLQISQKALEKKLLNADTSGEAATTAPGKVQAIQRGLLPGQIEELQVMLDQNNIALQSKIPALIVLEKAYPSTFVHKPDKLLVMCGALITSFIFAVLMVLVFNRKQEAL